MATADDLRVALVAIADSDVGAGGVRTLIGQTKPLRRWGDRGDTSKPISALQISVGQIDAPALTDLIARCRISVHVPGGSGGLEVRVIERYEVLIDHAALLAQGIDAAPKNFRQRLDVADLEQGGQRADLEFDVEMQR